MKIIRDGKTYELTEQELERAYRERDEYYHSLDVKTHIEEHSDKKCTIPYHDLVAIGYDAEDILEATDLYWEIYWGAYEEAINDYLSEDGLTIDDLEDM